MQITDIHSHILPSVDDGSSSLEESRGLLLEMQSQGINNVIATPHFNPSHHNLDDFLRKRQKAYERLTDFLPEGEYPKIHLGSEVYYYSGISKSSGINELCIENTNYLLLELNYDRIENSVLEDIRFLIYDKKIIPILAHIERYMGMKGMNRILEIIREEDIPAHINCSHIVNKRTRRNALEIIKKRYASIIATDAHNLSSRPPLMKKAFEIIEAELSRDTVERLVLNADNILAVH